MLRQEDPLIGGSRESRSSGGDVDVEVDLAARSPDGGRTTLEFGNGNGNGNGPSSAFQSIAAGGGTSHAVLVGSLEDHVDSLLTNETENRRAPGFTTVEGIVVAVVAVTGISVVFLAFTFMPAKVNSGFLSLMIWLAIITILFVVAQMLLIIIRRQHLPEPELVVDTVQEEPRGPLVLLGRTGRQNHLVFINPLNLRLSLVDRDFTENDFDALAALDTVSDRLDQIIVDPRSLQHTRERIEQLPVHEFSANPNHSPAPSGTPQDNNAPPTVNTSNTIVLSCPICLDNLQAGEKVKVLPCLHQFHAECVDRWLVIKPHCPICKFDALHTT
ncbi:E3 ubiquitin-protein ligase SDIR1 [Pelomyxa schiedti]|nr:E3 ubiquitin-protein ligase SDIR1 [Pelomyxa schiedti]